MYIKTLPYCSGEGKDGRASGPAAKDSRGKRNNHNKKNALMVRPFIVNTIIFPNSFARVFADLLFTQNEMEIQYFLAADLNCVKDNKRELSIL